MKKRTLVCFLIFLLCVFHSSLPDTVFGQDADPTPEQLAQQVFDEHNQVLRRASVKQFLPEIFEGLKGDLPLPLLNIINLAISSIESDATGAGLKTVAATFGVTLTDDHIAIIADADVQGVLEDDTTVALLSLTGDPLARGLDELLRLINESEAITEPTEPTEPTPPEPTDPTPPEPTEPTPPEPTEPTPPEPTEPTPPEPTEPTPPTGDELPPVNLVPSNLNGASRVGGLSLNRVHGRAFVRDLIVQASNGLIDRSTADKQVEFVVDFILAQVPQGFLPKKQIKQILTATQPSSIFDGEADSQLDFENFGNAIAPDLAEVIYTNVDNVTKYLASDNLNVYVRVPDTLLGGNVEIGLNGQKAADATRITPLVFQQDTIPYTFRLEETLAATNLPALPDADFGGNKIFSGVVLRYSQTGIDGEYIAVDMDPVQGEKGVVWVSEIGIPSPKENADPAKNVFYYFEVTLSQPVTLELINPEALGAAVQSADGTFDPTVAGNATKTYEINSWAMPDPRNIQLAGRGLFEALFTPDVTVKLAPIAAGIIGSSDPAAYRISGQEMRQLQNALLNSANDLFTRFESTFDPMLASVFSLPVVDIATESLWYANIDSIADGPVNFEARVVNGNGEVVDHITTGITADDTAPEATINIGTAEHASGYWNKDGIFVATANPADSTALVNITSTVTNGALGNIGEGDGYLIYQLIKLDEQGQPLSTWLPLTVLNSMLSSDLWDLVIENLPDDLSEFPIPGTDTTLNISQFPLELILSALQGEVPIPGVDIDTIIIDAIEDFVGIRISEEQYALYASLLGAIVDDINLIPITSDPSRVMTLPIQGENLPLLLGNYGIRAMGIDTLFNVGSHVAPTHLRVVMPEWDRTSITMAALGDVNKNGKDDPYESGTIYSNATDVSLTVMVDERTVHPGTIMVQYMDAGGTWQTIGELDLAEADVPAGTALTLPWSVTDFDDLVMAGDTVELRTVTTNGLQLTDESETLSINLDADVHPVDPAVLVVDVVETSFVMTNPDSGAPQGTIMLEGYSPRRTVPSTDKIRIEAKRMNDPDDAWTKIGDVSVDDPNGMSGADTAGVMFKGNTFVELYTPSETMLHIQDSGSYLKWLITLDTNELEDSITMANLAAAHAASNPEGKSFAELDDNRYMVRAYVVGVDGSDISPVLEGEDYTDTFSVDNVDDVAPLGQNMISVSQDGAYVAANEDGSFTVGGLVDKYDPEVHSPVITLVITPNASPDTYDSVELHTSLPEGAIIDFNKDAPIIGNFNEDANAFTVTIDVGTLMNEDGLAHTTRYLEDIYHENPSEFIYNPNGDVFSFTAYALAEDAAGNVQDAESILNADLSTTTAHEITVNVQNSYRDDPGVIAITVENSDGMVNPDSGAPQGELTFNVYTYYITSPPTEGISVEVKRPVDSTWERITGTAVDPVEVDISDVPGIADLDDITGGLIGITQAGTESGGESVVAIPGRYMKWQFIVDTRELALEDTVTAEGTIKLDDTISRGDASERDVSMDENQYEVRAISLTPKNLDHPEYPQRDGVEAFFSLDNVDDVPPLGPTNIAGVSDKDSFGDMQTVEANEDGSYTLGGIVDPSVSSPAGIFHIAPTAEPITYANGSLKLVQTSPDGTVSEAAGSLEDGYVEIDVGLLENGTYMYHALVVDEFGNVQVQGEADMPSPVVTVHVNNFRVSDITDLSVDYVDGVMVDGELPERIPLRESIGVSFNVPNGTLMVDDLTSVHVNGGQAAFTVGSDAENAFSLMASELSKIASGHYTVRGEVTKRNGSVTFPLAMVNLDNTAPMISFISPVEGEAINDLPTLHAEFNDGELGVGISDANTVVVSLARIRPDSDEQEEIAIDVDQSMVEQDIDSVVYTRIDKLAGGAYKFTVNVSDSLGNVGEASVSYAVEGINPTVMITAPASGQEFDASPASVTGFFAGGGEVNISKFTVNDVDVSDSVTVDGSNFTYMPSEGFGEEAHTVSVEVTDGSGLTAQTSLTFTVDYPTASVSLDSPVAGLTTDHTFSHIAGSFSGVGEVSVSLMLDGEAVEATVSGNQFSADLSDKLAEGAHTVSVMVTDANGETAEASASFTVVYPEALVSLDSPAAGSTTDHTFSHIAGSFSGVGEVSVSLMLDGEAVEATVSGNQFSADLFDKLAEGAHTVSVMVTDANGETAEASASFTVVYPEALVSLDSPAAGSTTDHTFSHIAGSFSGVGEVSVSLMLDGEAVEATVSGNQFSADLSDKLAEGAHTVSVMVTDANGETAEASASFTVVYPEALVSLDSPAAGSTTDHTFSHIAGSFSGVGEVSVSLMLDGEAVEATVSGNQFSADLSDKLAEGAHTVSVMVTDANGETAEASASFTVVYPEASVTLTSPTAGHTYSNGTPVISGSFTGVGEVAVKLTVDGNDAKVSVDGNQFTGELAGALGHGSHTVAVEVTDANGVSATTSAEFIVDLPGPSVAILSPAPAQTYGNGENAVIRVEYAGIDASVTSFTINGEDVAVEPEDNMFTHTPEGLNTGEYVVVVEVTDAANNKKAQDSVVFNVKLDSTPPVISEVAPSGTLHDTWVNISAAVSDEQSDIISVEFFIRNEGDTHKEGFLPLGTVISAAVSSATTQQIADGNILTQGSFGPGTHTLQVVATSEGGRTAHTWSFTVVTDNIKPEITSITPSGTIHAGLPTISASAHDESGVEEITITVTDSNGEAVAGSTQNDDEEGSVGITRSDFMPEMPLDEGTYVIEVRATDIHGNTSSAKGGFSIDFDTAAPLITSSSPQNGARLMYAHDDEKRPTISITYGDAETGVNVGSIRFVLNDELINLTDDQKSATQVIYMPPADLEPGKYTVKIEVSDNAQIQGNVSDEAEGAREANTAVYEFSFFVEHGDVPILKAAPFNYPNPFKDNTRISFVLARRSNVSITIYDVTLRPVRVLVDNEVMEAGYYTRAADGSGSNAIGWDGKSSNGEDLARGIYFCQIMVTDGIEPEYAILKLALTR